MAITDYTTPTSVRAVLGVSDDELEDVTIEDPVYATLLYEALSDLSLTLSADFLTTKAVQSPTDLQTRFVNLVSTWSAYAVARDLLTSVAMFAPQTITSDKDTQTRIADPYADLRSNVNQLLSSLGTRILNVYSQVFPSQPLPLPVVGISVMTSDLDVDPVTG